MKKYALLSVWDKQGLKPLAKELVKLGFGLVSSGGTAKFLKAAGIKVTEVQQITKYPHMLGGRVKTLHPLIHGGILGDPNIPEHQKDIKKFGIKPFELVVCNLYPFEQVISKKNFTHAEAIENIDIGGPCMVRAAAKNHKCVAIVVDPSDYKSITRELSRGGQISLESREKLALKAYKHTAQYDALIVKYLTAKNVNGAELPNEMEILLEKIQDLRYGENPHQKAAFYREQGAKGEGRITEAKQLHGKELSFNNIVDMEAAWQAANYFADPTIAIIKHTNPCGLASAETLVQAYKWALESDPLSAYGGIIAANRRIDEATAVEVAKLFVEVIIAPAYTPRALEILKAKANLRIMDMGEKAVNKINKALDFKRVSGGMLVQEADVAQLGMNEIKVVSKRQPTIQELEDLFFAWGVAKAVKSNAIVLVKGRKTVGVGAGQMSRIDSAEIAAKKAGNKIKGTVLASDAFFPFNDVVEFAAKHGITAIIQPGGAKRDQESIDKANEHNMAMVFTGRRHFKH
ncbi:bifunctional phosphoribosylaminoimidazolecarboxamide formyltransferase/IMP cyclohydrolase [candidate division WOR-1 bacterium RIFOXYB2_FULL_48_7]|uniref:Bifunctional purine biosynthesis protein PurH n=1 Tax=candidate division WOR-1 bacterium RIFOXYB2_FULL_48_7 TaxID=1802583 RepID=A0A1F4TJN0_UNCSA|nr:MAG: bifunctional phosphoribosylaminoimidazolecarboxamide formyltransferase/IMP cyclohydrolase [candidate division WOR-1 bacterium RIFOXYB2_FULL_48_7]